MLLHWGETYQTGYPEIDAQNKCMIDVLNVLHEAIEAESDYQTIDRILALIGDLAPDHFQVEEYLLEGVDNFRKTQNYLAHLEFLRMLRELRKSCTPESYNQSETIDLYYEIIYWFKDHLLSIDIPNLRRLQSPTVPVISN